MSAFAKLGIKSDQKNTIIDGVPAGFEPFVLSRISLEAAQKTPLIYVVRDGQHISDIEKTLNFIDPSLAVLHFPGWDCLPYDRVSPSNDTAARRLEALMRLIAFEKSSHRAIIITSVNALMQKLPPRSLLAKLGFAAQAGDTMSMNDLARRLESNGFERVSTVREVGEFAVRGGILDLFAPGHSEALRLDFFGHTLESIRAFDVTNQRTLSAVKRFDLAPMCEVTLNAQTIARFRLNYITHFGAARRDDALYAAVSEGRRFAGMEHWLPLFYENLETLFDYVPNASVVYESLVTQSMNERYALIEDHYQSRQRASNDKASEHSLPYMPIAPELLYMNAAQIEQASSDRQCVQLSPFQNDDTKTDIHIHINARVGRSFAYERQNSSSSVFDTAVAHIADIRHQGKKCLITAWSKGSLERLLQVLTEHHLGNIETVSELRMVKALSRDKVTATVLPIENGFETSDLVIVTEQDILGDRLIRRSKREKRDSNMIKEAAGLSAGDLVVHVSHGIGRFIGLRIIEALGAPHDCVELHYAGDDRLFIPVENIELLSRYGGEGAEATLDKLGGGAWQARKAKLKKNLLEMASQLIALAAERQMRGAPVLLPPEGIYGEFVARFSYEETEDQMTTIEAVLDDLSSGRPMDRLICGDVGFGKTEVAIRAAFVAAMNGLQVAIVVPTTLLARQHFKTFSQRFHGLPLRLEQASRLVSSKDVTSTKKGLTDGTVDIVVGTHALLGQGISFKNLGLLIIDEEQHFGVKHKERLKELKSDVHVLTLSATPIPRTLQQALTGVRELSLITTAPVDRMAVRTFISPFDGLVIRESLLREHYRGGQSFYVVPRISDLREISDFLENHVPELKVAIAHGQMPMGELDDVMNAFYEGQYDVLLSTTIVECGLDVPSANTLIIHRADMFGLAQLYQLRGRVGRSKQRAFALFTLPVDKTLTTAAERRLKVLQSLDTLGAGFQLASHDLDLRGGGNMLGDKQSGHIKEVGFELYQQMLEEAVSEQRGQKQSDDSQWSPQININTAVMIPDKYVSDLQLRLGLYRRLADVRNMSEIDSFGAEMIDRFGPMPDEVKHLLKIMVIKTLCRTCNIEKLDAGPRGLVIVFRNKEFPNPVALITYIGEQGVLTKIRPDQSIFLSRDWDTADKRLNGAAVIVSGLAKMVVH
jgi:transcription-repair coupling factor (superfamily II helicase)